MALTNDEKRWLSNAADRAHLRAEARTGGNDRLRVLTTSNGQVCVVTLQPLGLAEQALIDWCKHRSADGGVSWGKRGSDRCLFFTPRR